jgi:hypothetical protein
MSSVILGVLPVVLSLLVLGAHFLRASNLLLVALCIVVILLLLIPRRWAARTVQGALALAAIEWIRTLVLIVQERIAFGAPYTRTAIILGGVTVFALASILVFRMRALRRHYQLERQ